MKITKRFVKAGLGKIPLKRLFLLSALLILILIPSVSADLSRTLPGENEVYYNQSLSYNTDRATPFLVWIGAVFIGIWLIILSFMEFPHGEEGLISILAWFPIFFAAIKSYAVNVDYASGVAGAVTASGTANQYVLMESITVYHFDEVGIALFVLLVFSIGNTYRIYANAKALKKMSQGDFGAEMIDDTGGVD